MASRRARAAAAKGEPVPAVQITEYAYNVYGWAMKIPTDVPAFAGGIFTINAYEPSGTPWEKGVAAMKKNGEDPWRKSLSLTERESAASEEVGIQRYLLVGISSTDLRAEHYKKHKNLVKQKPIGTELDPDSIISTIDTQRLPLLVVTQIQDSEQQKTDLFVLLRPKNGLCTPYHIGQKECFYLPIFRDNTTDIKQRGPAWNQIVAKHALRPSDRPLSAKQIAYKKARNTSKVVLDPKVALQNEIAFLAEGFAKTGEIWHIQELSLVLAQADEDLQHTPPAANTAMRKFVDNDENFEDGDTVLMAEEIGQLWPDLMRIDPTDLGMLKEGLIHANIILEYRLMRSFLSEALFQIRKRREGGLDLLDVAEEAVGTVRRVLTNCESAVPIMRPDEEPVLLSAITTALKSVVEAARTFDKGLKDNSGDQTSTGTIHDIWEKYANALDTDSAKLAWFEAARYLTAATKYKQRGLGEMVEDVLKVLEEMKLEPGFHE